MPATSAPETFPLLRRQDPDLARLLDAEDARQHATLTLIASENHCSPAVRQAASSVLTDKYAEGYPGARYYGGCEIADQIEELARSRAKRIFGAAHANVQPHSGTSANLAVLEAPAGPKGKILGMALKDGGHLSHGHKVSATGKLFEAVQYGIDPNTGLLDYGEIRRLAMEHRPVVLIGGASSYPRAIDWKELASIAHEVGAALLADVAHPAGLVAGGVFPSPVGHADVVTMTTHKTLRGPRGGLVLCSAELAKKIDSGVFPGGQGGPLMHTIASKAVAFGEVLAPGWKIYAQAVLDNARHLAACLIERGLAVVTGGTDSHMVVIDLKREALSGQDVEERCRTANLAVNKNMVPGDQRSPRVTSGVRVGTAAATTRGLGKAEFGTIAEVLVAIVRGGDPEAQRPVVERLCAACPLP
ncbi:MAG: serine hydroxymethyltransferase [Planctomycetes bacterium]|nr:serine hydroxymethyltransferase [Planctomycetota bacterium]